MKTKLIDILNKIANGEQLPKKIYYLGETFTYDEQSKDYYDSETYGLFDSYEIPPILNDEVEILETTITYKPTYEIINNKKYLVKYENGEILYEYIEDYKPDKIEKLDEYKDLKQEIANIHVKIDEIIDRVNAND